MIRVSSDHQFRELMYRIPWSSWWNHCFSVFNALPRGESQESKKWNCSDRDARIRIRDTVISSLSRSHRARNMTGDSRWHQNMEVGRIVRYLRAAVSEKIARLFIEFEFPLKLRVFLNFVPNDWVPTQLALHCTRMKGIGFRQWKVFSNSLLTTNWTSRSSAPPSQNRPFVSYPSQDRSVTFNIGSSVSRELYNNLD